MGRTTLALPKLISGACQNLAYTGAASFGSNPVGSQTYGVLLYASSSCRVRISHGDNTADPALATDTFLPGGASPIPLGCAPGDRIKVIRDTADGTLNISELTY